MAAQEVAEAAQEVTLEGIKWEEPPTKKVVNREGPMQELAHALKQNPGKWAFLGQRSSSVAYNIRKGYGAFAPAGAFEATTRNSDKNRADIYVRFVGEQATQAAEAEGAN